MLDTSGSMAGDKITAARTAASKFIDNLQSNDQVAVLTFDRSTKHRIDFSLDHNAARQQAALVEATPGGYTCLYDAAYETIQLTGDLASGRRAIILLTDGKDEAANGVPCSLHTLDDVISLAASGNTPTPVYTIGLGDAVDTQTLESLASGTNGRYQYSPMPTQLEALFNLLQDELRSAYGLHYTSTATPGEHSLNLHVKYQSAEDEVSDKIVMPSLPYGISFSAPAQAAEITGKTSLAVAISGQGNASIQKVMFLANKVAIGSTSTPPYGLEWDPTGLIAGSVTLEVVAQDAKGTELAHSSISVTYKPAAVIPTTAPVAFPVTKGRSLSLTVMLLAAAAGLVLIILIVAVILLVAGKRSKQEKGGQQADWQAPVQVPLPGLGVNKATSTEDRTMDSFAPATNALGALIVLQSDDPSMQDQRIEIDHPLTHLGRKADNDIIFAKDSPVSRRHAVIEAREGDLFLSEVVAADETSGQAKRPAYGTFVNGVQVQEPVKLRDGDEIVLGKRLRMRFEALKAAKAGEERTLDWLEVSPEDETIAAYNDAAPSGSSEKPETEGTPVEAMPPGAGEKTFIPDSAGDASHPSAGEEKGIAGFPDEAAASSSDEKTVIAATPEQASPASTDEHSGTPDSPDLATPPNGTDTLRITKPDEGPKALNDEDQTLPSGGWKG
jgi:pSer/pThr/pTyr-binding forkhead associated (FHA) protein